MYIDNSANEAIEAANARLGQAFFQYADLRQRQKAMEIQQAMETQRLTQQATRDQEAAAMNKARLEAQERYNSERLKAQQATEKARSDTTAAKKADADAARVAQQGYVDKYGNDSDKAYFAAFGKLPAGHDPGGQGSGKASTESKQITAQQGTLDEQYRYWSAQKKDAENAGDADPDVSDTEQRAKRGKEEQYRAAVANMMQLEAMQARLRKRAFELVGGVMPAAPDAINPGGINPFQPIVPLPAGAPTVKIEDLNVPLPAGVTPFNPQGGVPGVPVPVQPVPQPIAPTPAPPTITPEQARDLLGASAAKMGKRPDLIQQMPPAPMSKVAGIKAMALRQHSDPIAARQFFYDLMILNGFNPLAAPVPDEQYNVNPGGRVDVRVLE